MRCLLSNSVAKDLAQIVRNSPLEVPLLWGNPERLRGLPGYSCANEAHTLQMLSSSFARVVAGIQWFRPRGRTFRRPPSPTPATADL